MNTSLILITLLSTGGILSKTPQTEPELIMLAETMQYYLTARLAIQGAQQWLTQNPDERDELYRTALNPDHQPQTREATSLRAVLNGEQAAPHIAGHHLHLAFPTPATEQKRPWRAFLEASEPAEKLAHLKQVNFKTLTPVKMGEDGIQPWIYKLLHQHTAAMLTGLAQRWPTEHSHYGLAKQIQQIVDRSQQQNYTKYLQARPLSQYLTSDMDIKDLVLAMRDKHQRAEHLEELFVITDRAGNEYPLLKGYYPRLRQPAQLKQAGLKQWRKQQLRPAKREVTAWMETTAWQLYELGEYALLNRFLENQERHFRPLEPQINRRQHKTGSKAGKKGYDPSQTLALVRYAADVLRPQGHSVERNYLQMSDFNGIHLLSRLEIQPTKEDSKE